MQAYDILSLYNRCAMLVQSPRKRMVSPSARALAEAETLGAFLTAAQYPVGPYLASCFAKGHWIRQPVWRALAGKAAAKWFDAHQLEAAHWWSQIRSKVETRALIAPGRELVKRRMLADGGADFCRAQPELTGGFNADSAICQACLGNEVCRG